ncbi:MAG: hypothetical protein GY757_57940 [bacterium]|nr:hypothetical protein [bacterium]
MVTVVFLQFQGDLADIFKYIQAFKPLPIVFFIFVNRLLRQVINSNLTGRCEEKKSWSCKAPCPVEGFNFFSRLCATLSENNNRVILEKKNLLGTGPFGSGKPLALFQPINAFGRGGVHYGT